MRNVPIARPFFGEEQIGKALRLIENALRTGQLAAGPLVSEFEQKFAGLVGVEHAIAVTNGTHALEIALEAMDIGKNHEVITTPFTFMATASAISKVGAKPVFVDIDPETFNIDPRAIEKAINGDTRAILPVHLYGQPAQLDEIIEIAKPYPNALILEDAAQAHGAELAGRRIGSIGDAATFSFYPTKNMTTAEGGMITTNSGLIAEKARMIRNQGQKIRYEHEMLASNYRMTEIAAALGIVQLAQLTQANRYRQANARFYDKNLKRAGIIKPCVAKNCVHVYHQYTVRVTPELGKSRDEVVAELNAAGVGTGIHYPIPLHMQEPYKILCAGKRFPIAEKLAQEVVSLPVHPMLSEEDLQYVCDIINSL